MDVARQAYLTNREDSNEPSHMCGHVVPPGEGCKAATRATDAPGCLRTGPVLQVANSWRTTAGLSDTGEPASWDSIIRGLDNNMGLGRFAGPGGWNNMDFLQVSALAWERSAV